MWMEGGRGSCVERGKGRGSRVKGEVAVWREGEG